MNEEGGIVPYLLQNGADSGVLQKAGAKAGGGQSRDGHKVGAAIGRQIAFYQRLAPAEAYF